MFFRLFIWCYQKFLYICKTTKRSYNCKNYINLKRDDNPVLVVRGFI